MARIPAGREDIQGEVTRQAVRVAFISTLANCILVAVKLTAGLLGSSGALVSDAINSAGDVASNILVMGGVAVSGRHADKEHQYGHEKLESIVSLFLAAALIASAGYIGYSGISQLARPEKIAIPGLLPLVVAAATMVVKEILFRYTRIQARQLSSPSLEATAWDHRSDVFSALGVFLGIGGARLGVPILEPVASLVICLLILKAGIGILKEAINVLLDVSVDEKTRKELQKAIMDISGVLAIDVLKTRRTGFGYYVEVEITCSRDLPLHVAHAIAEDVHISLENRFPAAKHVTVHVNPSERNGYPRIQNSPPSSRE